jgi:P-type Mg2+ transporter
VSYEQQPSLSRMATLTADQALAELESSRSGLSPDQVLARRARYGANVLQTHGVRAVAVLARQLRSYLLVLLLVAALVSAIVGEATEAAIIGAIMAMSVGLSFVNEYRSEKAVAALHAQIRHVVVAERAGATVEVAVTELVPGDVVHLRVGDIVPADLRLLASDQLECDEAALTGESAASAKTDRPSPVNGSPLDLPSCALMGTVVRSGAGRGVVVRIGAATSFGQIAAELGSKHELTAFQQGLQDFSRLLATITAILAGSILAINVALGRSVLESLLFALAIAVGLTPQLLPAIVTVSLATGARRLAQRQVIVKRLVCIEDLGNIDVLFTDKTGTLTEGHTTFAQAIGCDGAADDDVLSQGVACSDPSGNDLDRALRATASAAASPGATWVALDQLPFDHDRQLASVLTDTPSGRLLIVKGAPEAVTARCDDVSETTRRMLDRLFSEGARVVAVATKPTRSGTIGRDDERGLTLSGLLCFSDPPKADAASSLERLARLGVDVKIVTGDNGQVAAHLCEQVGLPDRGALTGAEVEAMDDDELTRALPRTGIFARVTPQQKARIIRRQRALGVDVGFLGDGVNDAVALHAADVGISVDTAADVAKDAADVVLLTKSLDILAEGVVEGRRIFANTIKYVLMGTSSNFGNMFSAAGASLFLSFLPMLPTQILLNNLLYDVSELTIPTDEVDAEMLARPSQWDIALIRRFMAVFGPISSMYDFLTFAVLLRVFHAGPDLFRSGWFVESLVTQTLVIFVIRTRRVPFFASRPSRPLFATTLSCAVAAVALPYIGPLARAFGFHPLPLSLLATLAVMTTTYLALAQAGTAFFFRPGHGRSLARVRPTRERRVMRRAARWHAWPQRGTPR